MGWILWTTGKAGWYFFAWGPQMIICLYLGYLCARKTGGDVLDWLVAAFVASLVPLAGVLIMFAVWWRTGTTRPGHHHDGGPAGGKAGEAPAATTSPGPAASAQPHGDAS